MKGWTNEWTSEYNVEQFDCSTQCNVDTEQLLEKSLNPIEVCQFHGIVSYCRKITSNFDNRAASLNILKGRRKRGKSSMIVSC